MEKVWVVVDARGSVFGVYRTYEVADRVRQDRQLCKRIMGADDQRVFVQCKYLEE